ncbi:MAG: DUF721 domain-containing protein [Gammaproteobacteria bacterium]|nr:DUF721 domain-containing protein [Gammaproteobacteria bacterium]
MKRIRNITAGLPGLERVAERAIALEQLAELTREAVPEPMRPHVLACAVRNRTLILFTDNAAWASQLRFIQPAILDAIADRTGHRLDSVRLKVQQAASSERPADSSSQSGKPDREISERSRALIESAADGISDPELAAALQRLARGPDQDA